MRRDLVLVVLLATAAFVIRTVPVWDVVFGPGGVSFLETDAWYHVRLIEHQVRHYPWRLTFDPFAAPGGQFVPIAPLLDTLISTAVVALHGRGATTDHIERVAAFAPPVLGAVAVVAAWALATRLFDRRAGLLAAALLAVLPGHFLDRSTLGFVDHHVLEALMALTVLTAMASALTRPSPATPYAVGAALALYLLSWGSGALLVALLGLWVLLYVPLATHRQALERTGTVVGLASLTALILVVAFQDPGMHRYASQILSVVALGGLGLALRVAAGSGASRPPTRAMFAAVAVVALAAAAVVAVAARDVITGMWIDLQRLAPDPARMGVLEARPLFLYSGEWRWTQPWLFFRTGWIIGLVAMVPLAVRVWRRRSSADLLLLVFAAGMFAATIGQNRFGYYLVPACAVLGGWLASLVLDWGGVPHRDHPAPTPRTRMPLAREAAIVVVAGGMFAPNLSPGVLLPDRTANLPAHWRDAMAWLRRETPPPFPGRRGDDDYYYARYAGAPVALADYTVMNWWDQGYWIIQRAHRVPVANPTQGRAPNAARFYAATEEHEARALLAAERSAWVVSDWELPFRRLADGTIMGRFQNVVDWAGADHARFYEVMYRRDGRNWTPVWVFHEPYYRSMAFRLSVLGGAGAAPANSTTLITSADRVDASGVPFRELLSQQTFATYDAALHAAARAGAGAGTRIVGLDPWQPAFPIAPLRHLEQRHAVRTPEQAPDEAPWVRVFAVR